MDKLTAALAEVDALAAELRRVHIMLEAMTDERDTYYAIALDCVPWAGDAAEQAAIGRAARILGQSKAAFDWAAWQRRMEAA